jgi:hypothetical protein
MRRVRNEVLIYIGIVAAVTVIFFAGAAPVSADGLVPNTFQPGTTISSQQVNDNFSALANALPKIKWPGQSSPVTLSNSWQNVASITVTPPATGFYLLMARASVEMDFGQNSTQSSSMVNICITPTSNGSGGGDCTGVLLGGPCQGSAGCRIIVPVTLFSPTLSVTPNVPVTYYLTANGGASSAQVTSLASGTMMALFLTGWLQ